MKTVKQYIHVGYGKTATTWLQDILLPQNFGKRFLGKSKHSFPNWLLNLNYYDNLTFEKNKETLKKQIAKFDRSFDDYIISSEAFTNTDDIYRQNHRIKTLFDNPHIILVIRNPINWLISRYKYWVAHEGIYQKLDDLIDFSQERRPFVIGKRKLFYLPDLFYNEIIQHYYDVFGKKKVCVLKYELLVENAQEFCMKFGEFTKCNFAIKKDELKNRVLKSPSNIKITELRKCNFMAVNRSILGKDRFKFESANQYFSNFLSQNVKEKLKTYLQPHCNQYYEF